EQDSEGGLSPELVRSYLNFAKRSIRTRWWVSLLTLAAGLGITMLLLIYLPRTYSCTTVLMPVGNPILDGRDLGQPFVGASDLIMRHENLERMISELDLITKQEERRPKLLKLKDKLMRLVSSEPSQEVKIGSLVG